MRCAKRLEYVLAQFAAMGATDAELDAERTRLLTEDDYYREWCDRITEWCPAFSEDPDRESPSP